MDITLQHTQLESMLERAAAKALALVSARPIHVTQTQAAEILHVSKATVSRMVQAGKLRLNKCGMIPMTAIDEVIK